MIDTTALTLIISAHIIAMVSPGPDFIVVLKNSLSTKRAGIFTTLGITTGIAIHLLYSFLGLAVFIAKSILLFTLVKYLGASYLIYLGLKSLFAKKGVTQAAVSTKKTISNFEAFKQGFLTNLLNPKAAVYFVSLFSLIVTPELVAIDMILISGILLFLVVAWFSLVTIGISTKFIRTQYLKAEHKIQKVFGAILVALGLKVMTSD